MLPSNTWNTNIYNESLGFTKKIFHKDNNMGVGQLFCAVS